MPVQSKVWYILIFVAYAIAFLWLAFAGKQNNFTGLIVPWIITCICFIILQSRIQEHFSLPLWWVVPLSLKFILIFIVPELSNDYYRFWWDGYLTTHGINPYQFTPEDVLQNVHPPVITGHLSNNIGLLNSPEYFTVYPVFMQGIFSLSAFFSGSDTYLFSVILKFLYLTGDLITLYFCMQILHICKKPASWSFLYFGNPLCMIELQGNLHTEQFMILFLAAAIYFYLRSSHIHFSWTLSFAILSKINALLFIPMFSSGKSFLRSTGLLAIVIFLSLALLFYPISGHADGFVESLSLYFKEFEFNSLIYAFVRDLLYANKMYELQAQLGFGLLALFILVSLIIMYKHYKSGGEISKRFQTSWWILFAYLCLSSTVHPWYLCPIVFLGIFYLPISSTIWSFMVFLSYSHYDPAFQQSSRVLTISTYLIAFLVIYFECRGKLYLNGFSGQEENISA
ncbi:MAG: hypothetical protein IPM34_10560 [Saprospiraceae bacterium]|nr:hypothetical protein [Saprospiraceae bacterium]